MASLKSPSGGGNLPTFQRQMILSNEYCSLNQWPMQGTLPEMVKEICLHCYKCVCVPEKISSNNFKL